MSITTVDTPPPRRFRPLLLLGWLLAIPGLWMIASFLLHDALMVAAGCRIGRGIAAAQCPAGPLGQFAVLVNLTVMLGAVFSVTGLSLVPPLYSVVFVLVRAFAGLRRFFAGERARASARVTAGPPRTGKTLAMIWLIGVGVVLGVMASRYDLTALLR